MEDVFTVIHQSLLVVNSALTLFCVGDFKRPNILSKVEDIVNGFKAKEFKEKITNDFIKDAIKDSKIIGVIFSANNIKIHYNLPLKSHSCQLFITYHHKRKIVDLKVELYGHIPDRWYEIATFVILKKLVGEIFHVKDIVASSGSVSFTFEIGSEESLNGLNEIIMTILLSTFDNYEENLKVYFRFVKNIKQINRNDIPFDNRLALFFLFIILSYNDSLENFNADFVQVAMNIANKALDDADFIQKKGLDFFSILSSLSKTQELKEMVLPQAFSAAQKCNKEGSCTFDKSTELLKKLTAIG